MAQPTPYFPTYIFQDQEWKADLLPLWDVEFNNLSQTIQETLHNLSLIQRDDTKLANGVVHPLAMSPETLQLLNMVPQWSYQGLWVIDHEYFIGDMVVFNNATFVAVKCHTSGICVVEPEPAEITAPCEECVYLDPENPTQEELELCFMAEFEDRERWVPLCCGFGDKQSTDCLEDTHGTNIAYQITSLTRPPIVEYTDGMTCKIRWHIDSGLNATLDVDGVGVRPICFDSSPTDDTDLEQNSIDLVTYNAVTDCFDIIGRDRVVVPTYAEPWNTGDTRTTIRTTAANGWTFLDGLTIGDIGSGADFEGSEYENLFELLKGVVPNDGSELWANGDTVTKPDARGRGLYGWDLMADPAATPDPTNVGEIMGNAFGDTFHQLTEDEMPSHVHAMASGGKHTHGCKTSSYDNSHGTDRVPSQQNDNSAVFYTWGGGAHAHTIYSAGEDVPFSIQPPVLVQAMEIRL